MKKFLISLMVCFSLNAQAKEQILVLSGGDDPGLNHYSQYLQTKVLYEYLATRYGQSVVSLYFGAGNNPQNQPQPLDVHKIINSSKNKNDKTDVMLTGIIANNNPATKSNVTAYFFSPKLHDMPSRDNLLLFVSDHGMPYEFLEDKTADPFINNCIDLWHYQKPFVNNFMNANDFSKACLSKNELVSLLNQLPNKHILFEMSQCYSGGFHQLSVTEKEGYPTANPKICGFTAATPDHYASGCTADANGDTYQGYERSFTEWYTGRSVLTGEKIREPAKDLFSAHQNAILEDMTVDVPLTTSDYYLLKWSDLLMSVQFIPRVSGYDKVAIKKIYNNYQREMATIENSDFKNFVNLRHQSEQKICSLVSEACTFKNLSLKEQDKRIKQLEHQIELQGNELTIVRDGMMNVYLNLMMPKWESAINQHQVNSITAKEYLFEKEFYQEIIKQGLYKHSYQFDMYYLQYLSSKNNDKDLVRYKKMRDDIMKQWAAHEHNETLVNAINYFQTLNKKQEALQDLIANAEKNKQLLKRIMTYNKIIAAWVTLIEIHDDVALKDLQDLIRCEHSS